MGRPALLIFVKLPPAMIAPEPSVANALTVPFAVGAQFVKSPLVSNAARLETVAVVPPLWLDTSVNFPPT